MALGNKLQKILDERNITVKDFAADIGVPPTTLYSFIKRDSKTGKLELIALICKGLGLNISEFLTAELETFDTPEEFEKAREKILKNSNSSSESITVIHKSSTEKQLLSHFKKLNKAGEKKALEQVEMLTKVPEYQLEYAVQTIAKAVQDDHIQMGKKKVDE